MKNLYGDKDAERPWNCYFHEELIKLVFIESKANESVYYCPDLILAIYVDDCITLSPDSKKSDKLFEELKQINFEVMNKGKTQIF